MFHLNANAHSVRLHQAQFHEIRAALQKKKICLSQNQQKKHLQVHCTYNKNPNNNNTNNVSMSLTVEEYVAYKKDLDEQKRKFEEA